MLKQNSKFEILMLYELTGAPIIAFLFYVFNMKFETYILIPFLAVPFAILNEIIGGFAFFPIRKISIFYDLKSEKKDGFKNQMLLMMNNTVRSYITSFIMIIIVLFFVKHENKVAFQIITSVSLVIFCLGYCRTEYYFRKNLYNKKNKNAQHGNGQAL